MNWNNKQPSAFPFSTGSYTEFGMTLREYAAIKLKVPDSGTDWLDDMIRKSNEFDMMLLTNQQQSNTL
jgi:hypothetical protein